MASNTNDASSKRDSFLGDGYAFESSKKNSSPEKKAKRGTPKQAVTHVTEKHEKPIKNIYGEDQMPSDNNQRLQQCIIFLSDEGPENYPNFKYMLKKLEHEIGHIWPQKKRQDKKFCYDDHLYRKVKAMMRVQRARVDSGARLWFEQTMFPEYAPSASEAEIEYPPPAIPRLPGGGRGRGRGHHGDAAKLAEANRQRDAATKALQARDKADTDKKAADDAYAAVDKDPFAEEMPRPEIWHRNMPNSFPFGETPYMERELSKQISRDLGESTCSFCSLLCTIYSTSVDADSNSLYRHPST